MKAINFALALCLSFVAIIGAAPTQVVSDNGSNVTSATTTLPDLPLRLNKAVINKIIEDYVPKEIKKDVGQHVSDLLVQIGKYQARKAGGTRVKRTLGVIVEKTQEYEKKSPDGSVERFNKTKSYNDGGALMGLPTIIETIADSKVKKINARKESKIARRESRIARRKARTDNIIRILETINKIKQARWERKHGSRRA